MPTSVCLLFILSEVTSYLIYELPDVTVGRTLEIPDFCALHRGGHDRNLLYIPNCPDNAGSISFFN